MPNERHAQQALISATWILWFVISLYLAVPMYIYWDFADTDISATQITLLQIENSIWGWAPGFPLGVVELISAGAMATLGTVTVHLRKIVTKESTCDWLDCVLQPVSAFGMGVIVLTFCKGMPALLLSSSANQQGGYKINPYVIGFLCLGSGLFTDETLQVLKGAFMTRISPNSGDAGGAVQPQGGPDDADDA